MSLQRRLALFFVLIVILPLVAAGFVVQRVIVGEVERRAVGSLRPALDATIAHYARYTGQLDRQVRLAATSDPAFSRLLQRRSRGAIDRYFQQRLLELPDIDFLGVADAHGRLLGFAATPARGFVRGVEEASPAAVAEATSGASVLGFHKNPHIRVVISGTSPSRSLEVFGGFWLDRELLLDPRSDVELSIAAGERIIASTAGLRAPEHVEIRVGEPFEEEVGEPSKVVAEDIAEDVALLASTRSAPLASLSRRVLTSMLVLLLLALAATSVLAFLLARLITQPLEELAHGARAISEGRFDYRIPVRSKDEVGQLASAFNNMTERLSSTVTQLSSSRDQLQRAIRRVGETLRSTHDMSQMLESVLNTAADAVDADVAILWRFTHTRDELYPYIASGAEVGSVSRIKVGEGLVGAVAERAMAILVPSDGEGPRYGRNEPWFPVAVATPLYSQDRVRGVIAAYREDANHPFTQEDLETVRFLAEQGGVAIENVLLHEEAQRLSLTDGLTGVWNRRYFQMQFRQVQAVAARFGRPFSVLMMDLDHFKDINDTYGHQRGDAILIEFSQRVTNLLREVDTFARYGGEEFICLLSETDLDGAIITAEKILDATKREAFGGGGEVPIKLTVSVGVASYPDHGDSFKALVEAADRALYAAKADGRDRLQVARGPAPPELKIAK